MVATVTSIGSASATVHYFEQDGHYAKGEAVLRGVDRAFVTDRALRAERGNIAWMRDGAGAGQAAAEEAAVETELAAGPLTEGQRDAVRTILLARDRVVGVQGHAGTGKTPMLRETARLAGERKVLETSASILDQERFRAPKQEAARRQPTQTLDRSEGGGMKL